MKEVNLSLLIKLAWNFLNGKDDWSKLMRAKFTTKAGNIIFATQGSSVWAGVRWAITEVEQRNRWIIGNEEDIDLWRDNWCHQLSLKDLINSDSLPWSTLKAKLSCIIVDGQWNVPTNLAVILHRLNIDINGITISSGKPDKMVWKPDVQGKFSVKSAFKEIRKKGQTCWWSKYLYRKAIHPRLGMWGWRLIHDCLPTDENIRKKGIVVASMCCLCKEAEESSNHI
ncbi:hypothetical protein GIB67_042544 [Kingdonia uniflora]|uniref:Reverse transcriptase zinc-binding domain-containing protein n=1 Tax=Kingdonia uniflora TaxID=39325 RepID=A0A7J7M135_9MAGN|nr:hypothetical protein GIB67_042544 [Kingdonia uniflora]